MDSDIDAEFSDFFAEIEPRLRLALVATFGSSNGRDAAAEALLWGWQHWDQARAMDNPAGYLYRVGYSYALKASKSKTVPSDPLVPMASADQPDSGPELVALLSRLSDHQRVALWLVHGLGYRHREVAEVLECSASSVATHVRRALEKLRQDFEVNIDG